MVTESRPENLEEVGIKDSHEISVQTLMHVCSGTVFKWKITSSPCTSLPNKIFNSSI